MSYTGRGQWSDGLQGPRKECSNSRSLSRPENLKDIRVFLYSKLIHHDAVTSTCNGALNLRVWRGQYPFHARHCTIKKILANSSSLGANDRFLHKVAKSPPNYYADHDMMGLADSGECRCQERSADNSEHPRSRAGNV